MCDNDIENKGGAMKTEYYKVLAKCGHVGRHRYITKWFYVKASSGKEAAYIVRYKPRVKHNHKDAIREVVPITYDEYIEGIKIMASDMYFNVHNSTDQKLYNCIKQEDLYPEEKNTKIKKDKSVKTRKRIKYEIMDKESKKIIRGVVYDE